MKSEQMPIADSSPSSVANAVLGVVSPVKEYIDFLEKKICEANVFGKKCQRVDKDLDAAARWYSIAEAFVVSKEKAIELLGSK